MGIAGATRSGPPRRRMTILTGTTTFKRHHIRNHRAAGAAAVNRRNSPIIHRRSFRDSMPRVSGTVAPATAITASTDAADRKIDMTGATILTDLRADTAGEAVSAVQAVVMAHPDMECARAAVRLMVDTAILHGGWALQAANRAGAVPVTEVVVTAKAASEVICTAIMDRIHTGRVRMDKETTVAFTDRVATAVLAKAGTDRVITVVLQAKVAMAKATTGTTVKAVMVRRARATLAVKANIARAVRMVRVVTGPTPEHLAAQARAQARATAEVHMAKAGMAHRD